MKMRRLLPLTLAAALVAGACSSSDSSGGDAADGELVIYCHAHERT